MREEDLEADRTTRCRSSCSAIHADGRMRSPLLACDPAKREEAPPMGASLLKLCCLCISDLPLLHRGTATGAWLVVLGPGLGHQTGTDLQQADDHVRPPDLIGEAEEPR